MPKTISKKNTYKGYGGDREFGDFSVLKDRDCVDCLPGAIVIEQGQMSHTPCS